MLAEHVGLWSLMPYVIVLTAIMVALQIRPHIPQITLAKHLSTFHAPEKER